VNGLIKVEAEQVHEVAMKPKAENAADEEDYDDH
jgi:hypothetical protein